ncbi:MAG: aldo/keto reductase, partial [Deltaproteobacteria bacterium]|nr:aldo/keto reductase [Deltaproteobacteria bacterium]
MKYRRLGTTGLKLSELSFGSWVTFQKQLDQSLVLECMQTAYDAGVNFFDNAEVYSKGQAEELMGQAIRKLGWRRGSYVVSTKFFWGLHDTPNEKRTLNRKYLMQAIEDSLRRMQLDFVDIVYCHRPDPETPIEETVWAMSDMIARGRALYWGTSEWSAAEIEEAFQIAERLGLRMPVVEQPEYNLLTRRRVEEEYAPLFEKRRLGTTIWSPLASGLLSGKYSEGASKGGRLNMAGFEWLKEKVHTDRNLAVASEL